MQIYLLLASFLPSFPPAGAQEISWLDHDRVLVRTGDRVEAWPGSEGTDTYCWDRDGRSLLITRAGILQRLDRNGRRTTLAHGYTDMRFPDVDRTTGRIAFACTEANPERKGWRLRVIEADGRGNLELGSGYDPAFLPDGSGVIFEGFDEPGPDIWIHRFDTQARRRLFDVAAPGGRCTPAISPDGKRVAYTSLGRLFVVGFDGLALRDLSPQGATYDRFACFAPDGNSVAFFRERELETALVLRPFDGEERIVEAGLHATLPMFRPQSSAPIIRSLDPASAAVLVTARGSAALDLPDLESLDAATASVLATTAGSLLLDRLVHVDLATAEALAAWDGNGEGYRLSLDGLTACEPAILAALSRSRGWSLSFGSLVHLESEHVRALAPFTGAVVRLRALEALDESTAKSVAATWKAKWLEVDFETKVSVEARHAFGAGTITLRGARP